MNFWEIKQKIHLEYKNGDFVKSIGGKITYSIGENTGEINLNNKIYSSLALIKPFRRALRLNRLNVKALENNTLLIIKNSNLYIYDLVSKRTELKFKFPFTKYVHNETISIQKNNIVIGEYGNSNHQYDIGVFISNDFGKNWNRKTLYNKGSVKNILSIGYDSFEKNYWVYTGDNERDCSIRVYNKNFDLQKIVGENSFTFRAISSIYTENEVIWLMNNPFGESNVVVYNRTSELIEIGQQFLGPIWYSTKLSGIYFATTAAESSPNRNFKMVYLYKSIDFKNWELVDKYKKDFLNKKVFLFGLISFSDQDSYSEYLNVYFDGVEKKDGNNYKLDIKQMNKKYDY